MCVDPVHPLHRPTNDFPTVSLDQLTVIILPLECCIVMFSNFYTARATLLFYSHVQLRFDSCEKTNTLCYVSTGNG